MPMLHSYGKEVQGKQTTISDYNKNSNTADSPLLQYSFTNRVYFSLWTQRICSLQVIKVSQNNVRLSGLQKLDGSAHVHMSDGGYQPRVERLDSVRVPNIKRRDVMFIVSLQCNALCAQIEY